MSEDFPELKYLGEGVKVKLNLSNCATKSDLKNSSGVDISKFTKKFDLASVKSTVEKLDTDKLKSVPATLFVNEHSTI